MRVLVTGARGFLGRHTLRPLLEAGFEVHGLSRGTESASDSRVTWHRGDLLDDGVPAAIIRDVHPTHLLHLAWEATHPTYWSSPANEQWVDASIALGRAFLAHGGTRFVGAGSCAEYDWQGDGVCDEEATPVLPATLYGASKLNVAQAIGRECELRRAGFAWARMFFLYGAHDQPGRLIPSVIDLLRKGATARVTSGMQRRDFLYVADCANALVQLLVSDRNGVFNVGSGEAIAVKDVVSMIASLLNAEDRVAYGALPVRPDDPPLIVAVTARLRSLGWAPAHDIRGGITATLRESEAHG